MIDDRSLVAIPRAGYGGPESVMMMHASSKIDQNATEDSICFIARSSFLPVIPSDTCNWNIESACSSFIVTLLFETLANGRNA